MAGAVALNSFGWMLAGNNVRAQTTAGATASGSAVAPSTPPARSEHVDFVGRTKAVQTIEVRHSMPGLLTKIAFREGQEVRQGDLLFEFDSRPQQAALELAQAELARAQAELTGVEADLGLQKQLGKTAAVSQAEIERAAVHIAAAKANVEAARAKLQSAQLTLESTRIASPITGRVGRAYLSTGNWVLPSTILTVIVSQDPIHVFFDVDERQYLQSSQQWRQVGGSSSVKPPRIPVQIGLPIEEGFPHEGVIDFVDNRFDATTGTIRMRAILPNPDGLMLPGLFVRIRLPLETPRKP
jgi:multidrug efflux system membrane fusion protein